MRTNIFSIFCLLTYFEGTKGDLVEMVTPNIYATYLQMVDNGIDISGVTEITFELKNCNDGFVGLAESKTNKNQFYEILLGGWGGTRLGIRNGVSEDLEDFHDDASIYSCSNYKEYWIRWAGGVVQVGTGLNPGVNKLVNWADPAPHTVNFLLISSGFGSTGNWKFYNQAGGWASWGRWSGCEVQPEGFWAPQRTRTCSNPPPELGGSCPGGVSKQLGSMCNPQNGGFGGWSTWTSTGCSLTCGGGSETLSRDRNCDSPEPMHGGKNCVGDFGESSTEFCNVQLCPVDGGFGEWSTWTSSECSVPCGGGNRTLSRERPCDSPEPTNGGQNCSGDFEESTTELCNELVCKDTKRGEKWTKLQNNGQITLGIFSTISSKSRTDCCRFCQETENCEGATFHKATLTCRLSSQFPLVEELESADAWETWVRK